MQDARENADATGTTPLTRESVALPAASTAHPLLPTPTTLAFGLIMLGVVLSVWGYRRVMASALRRAQRSESSAALAADSPANPDEVRSLIDGATRDLAERAEHLEALVARAERAAERLERLHGAERANAITPRPTTPAPAPKAPRPEPGAPSLFDGSPYDVHRGAPAFPGSMIEHRPAASDAPRHAEHHDDPLQREIERLSRTGLSPVEIAQKLEQPVGQVELVLALRGARG